MVTISTGIATSTATSHLIGTTLNTSIYTTTMQTTATQPMRSTSVATPGTVGMLGMVGMHTNTLLAIVATVSMVSITTGSPRVGTGTLTETIMATVGKPADTVGATATIDHEQDPEQQLSWCKRFWASDVL